ncbi:hypothetical protein FXW07_08970 [Methanosarcina sp. DH1]|uniref:hypothetical protein n=1 Tax=Methanosarcina sp. DH1 TaxID=2605695 RepID=UPI001E29DBD1|nr:hypothetical protein [Methanosarcina sp. DH1]MCC4766740.1 hypothetical protein [Methanosarcina sp. DH1]
MEEIQLKVEDASLFDRGIGIIRLDPTTLLKLQISPGDIVEIRGKKKTAAIVWGATNMQDWDQGFVRIDNFIRQNADVSIGEKVTIRKVEATKAKKLVLEFPEGMTQRIFELQLGKDANEIIKWCLLKRPIFRGDTIPIMTAPQAHLTSSPIIPLVTVETDPSNTIVQVSYESTIEFSHKTVQSSESPESPEEEKEPVLKLAINDFNKMLKQYNLEIKKKKETQEIYLGEINKNEKKEIKITPSVFEIPKKSNVLNCVSVMMPFSAEFSDVYGCINDACYEVGMSCHKADDFWHHSVIIQDIFELIFRSSIVIVDFTGKNPNVFYEAGVAHVLGKTVLPIIQNGDDIPFDLRHHRYVLYRNDREGLKKLKRDLVSKLNFEKNRE